MVHRRCIGDGRNSDAEVQCVWVSGLRKGAERQRHCLLKSVGQARAYEGAYEGPVMTEGVRTR